MVDYLSGKISFGGLTENTDFETLLNQLQQVEMRKANQLLNWRSDWDTRLQAFQEVRTAMVDFQTKLKSMNTIDKFLTKSAASSKPEVAKATTGDKCSPGSYNLEVNQLANYGSWSFQTSYTDKNDKINTTGTSGSIEYTYKGKTRTINVPNNTTLEGLKNMINNDSQNPGVVAQLVNTPDGIRFQLRGKDTGRNAELSINSVTGLDAGGISLSSSSRWDTTSTAKTNMFTQYFNSPYDVVNPGKAATYTFNDGSTNHTINLAADSTWAQLIGEINALPTSVSAGYVQLAEGGYVLGTDTTGVSLTETGLSSTCTQNSKTYSSLSEVINPNNTPRDFVFSIDGNKTTVELKPGATLADLIEAVNSKTSSTGVRAIANIESGGGVSFSLQQVDASPAHPIVIENGSLTEFSNRPEVSNWVVQEARNAEVRYNGWPAEPNWLEVESNTLTDLLDTDLTVTLYDTGKTTITVEQDYSGMVDKVVDFVDAINTMRMKLKNLTKFDENKDVYDPDYAESQFEMQKGSVLTGNYGIQMIESRFKSICANSGSGFIHRTEGASGELFGDIFTSLSQIGIMTNADSGSDMYGMLEIKEETDNKGISLTDAIKKDPMAVATLLGAKSTGYSTVGDFGHVSHIDGITKSGVYDVKYEVHADGSITGTINGKTAVMGENNTLGIYNSSPPPNAADGLVVEVYNLAPGTYEGQVGIKQGKANELLATMDGAQGYLGKEGTLAILENNYKKIMDNIDDKISKEDERISKWARTMKNRFARIEAQIATYQQINTSLQSQIKQIPGYKSGSS